MFGTRSVFAACAALVVVGGAGFRSAAKASVSFGVVGDYGYDSKPAPSGGTVNGEVAVAEMINSWNPNFVVSVGDTNYGSDGSDANYQDPTVAAQNALAYDPFPDANQGTYLYQRYTGTTQANNNFFPAEGNADWGQEGGGSSDATWFANTFPNLPANQNATPTGGGYYYSFTKGTTSNGSRPLVQFFMLDSDQSDPSLTGTDGNGNVGNSTAAEVANSPQGKWLQAQLASSNAVYKLVVFHHAPYTSLPAADGFGNSPWMQLPYQQWGATAVFNGHAHNMEYLLEPDSGPGGAGPALPYFVSGIGGKGYDYGTPIAGSQYEYNADGSNTQFGYDGAMLVNATDQSLTVNMYAVDPSTAGDPTHLLDTVTIEAPASAAVPAPAGSLVAGLGLALLLLPRMRRRLAAA